MFFIRNELLEISGRFLKITTRNTKGFVLYTEYIPFNSIHRITFFNNNLLRVYLHDRVKELNFANKPACDNFISTMIQHIEELPVYTRQELC